MLNQLFYHNDLFTVFIFVGGWLLICCIGSVLGGWHEISKKYRRKNVTNGRLFQYVTMYLSAGRYNHVLFVRVGQEGLDISVILPCRLLHPPLLIPWEAFESCVKAPLYFSKRTRLTIRNPKYPLYFTGDLAEEIEKCYHQFATNK